MRSLTLLLTVATLWRGHRARAPRGAPRAVSVSPTDDAAAAEAQLERLAACWATRHPNAVRHGS